LAKIQRKGIRVKGKTRWCKDAPGVWYGVVREGVYFRFSPVKLALLIELLSVCGQKQSQLLNALREAQKTLRDGPEAVWIKTPLIHVVENGLIALLLESKDLEEILKAGHKLDIDPGDKMGDGKMTDFLSQFTAAEGLREIDSSRSPSLLALIEEFEKKETLT
jgi:hypothetical protein